MTIKELATILSLAIHEICANDDQTINRLSLLKRDLDNFIDGHDKNEKV